jgi:hypothetical protein
LGVREEKRRAEMTNEENNEIEAFREFLTACLGQKSGTDQGEEADWTIELNAGDIEDMRNDE